MNSLLQSSYSMLFAVSFAATTLVACMHQGTAEIPTKVVYENSQCPFSTQSTQLIHSTEELTAAFDKGSAKKMFGAKTLPADLESAAKVADFENSTWVLVAWGSQPNPGYKPKLHAEKSQLKEGTLTLPLIMEEPLAGEMQAQVLVSPCQVLEIQSKEPVTLVELGLVELGN